jgi:GT2 family glycosyltransferase
LNGRYAQKGSGLTLLTAVIFSKDRPLQLDATIRSLLGNCEDVEVADLKVLYLASTPAFSAGYRILAIEHERVSFHPESDFKADLLGLVEASAYVLFLVDDTIFVGPTSLGRTIEVLDEDPACLAFSYRLGRNTTYCYSLDKPQGVPTFDVRGSGILTFEWTASEHDFGYPLELSSSLYRAPDVLPLLRTLGYRNPNTLESVLARQTEAFREKSPLLACYARSVAFSVPANLVQTEWENRTNGNLALTTEALRDAFARGQRLDVDRYRGLVANACHQELEFLFTRQADVPTVSVIIPCYGQAEYLPEAVRSVLSQTFTDWELIVVDDGSPDDTADVATSLIAAYPERHIRLIRQANAGLASARNAGIARSKGRYVLPLDADDMIAPSMLEQTVSLLERDQGVSIAYTDLQQFGGENEVIQAAEFDPHRLPEANHLSYCALYRREVWEAVGGYNPNMSFGYEDWDFWLGSLERGYGFRRVPEPLLLYRVRGESMYSNALKHDTVLRRQMRLNHPSAYRWTNRAARWLQVAPPHVISRIRHRIGAMARSALTRVG